MSRSPTLVMLVMLVVAVGGCSNGKTSGGCSPAPGAPNRVFVEAGPDAAANGQKLADAVNGGSRVTATTFCLSAGTYSIGATLVPHDGDRLIGERGALARRGPAYDPDPVVLIRNGASLPQLVRPRGNVTLRWLDIAGAAGVYVMPWKPGDPCINPSTDGLRCPQNGTGVNVAMGHAMGNALLEYVRIADSDAVGVGNAKGKIFRSEFVNNSRNVDFHGFTAAAVQGVTEYEAAYNYVHDNAANGLWCDHGCEDDPARANGAWFHENLVVNNARWGIRYEYSPRARDGEIFAEPTLLVENNEVHGNGETDRGGASMQDAQNGTFRGNNFGPATIAGVSYPGNHDDTAIVFSESREEDRTDLYNGDGLDNALNGEAIEGCEKPDKVVFCSGNAP